MTNQKIDPELVDDRNVHEVGDVFVDIPEYNPEQFELPDDFEYTEELDGEGEVDGS